MLQVLGRFACEQFAEQFNIPLDELNSRESRHKLAIINYTSRRHIDINSGIRNNESDPKHLRAVKLLQEALLALNPCCEREFLVRWSDLSPALIEAIKAGGEGSYLYEEGFTSCSADSDFVFDTERKFRVIIKHLSGRSIAHLSVYKHENEVLIPAFTTFKIHKFDEDDQTLYLEEVNPSELESGDFENLKTGEEAVNEQ